MTLQNFTPKARIQGDKFDLRNYFGRPLLVRVNEYVPDFSSNAFPNPKPVVFVDVVDLYSGQIAINALWGGGAVVDNLREYAGTEVALPLMAENAVGGQGRNYIALKALDQQTAAQAAQWHAQYWGLVDQARAQKQAQAGAAPAQQSGQFGAPQNQAPAQGGQFAAPGGQPSAPQGQQFGAPAAGQQFGAPQGQGMFTDGPPPVQPGQQFGAPQQGTDPAAAQAALAQLNNQIS